MRGPPGSYIIRRCATVDVYKRQPYGLHEILDGTTTIAVRPYVTAHEQRQRRRELAMAAMGFDMPGPYWIHGTEVA
ncbi:hypothetical protein PV395_39915 [Streptomyces scabiei]|nr:hypothetical protein [Streptomyces scabiei]MDX2691498.1 hypothetical protein [Streptomyces scabiei]